MAFVSVQGQVVKKKNLLISMGGGVSYGAITSTHPAYNASSAWGGNITFGFAYAFNANWGLGIRFDRLGYTSAYDTLSQARATVLQLHGTYRPWQTEVHALEIETGVGLGTLSLRGNQERVPAEARAYAFNVSLRYLRTVHKSLIVFCALRGSSMGTTALIMHDQGVLLDAPGSEKIGWQGLWINAGFAVRW